MCFALHAELSCLLIRRYHDSKPNMKFARIKQAHAESFSRGIGRLHAFIHKPKTSVAVEEIVNPNSCRPVPCSTVKQ